MPNLSCQARECAYNKQSDCYKGAIMVAGGGIAENSDDTFCDSFIAKRDGDSFVSAMDTKVRATSIDCEASSCTHNSNYRCLASSVSIQGGNTQQRTQTACATFEEKRGY